MGKRTLLVVVGVLVVGGYFGLDFLIYPWAYPRVVGAGPIGAWEGTVRIPVAGEIQVLYRLRHEIYREEGPALEGESYTCAPDQVRREGHVTGRPSWLGRTLTLSDSGVYGTWGSPASMECSVAAGRMECVMNFSRPSSAKLAREPVRFALQRVETDRTLPCRD